MTFFPEQSSQYQEFRQLSVDLRQALKTARKDHSRTNLKSWDRVFSSLCKRVGKEQVVRVLKWYCGHIQDEFVPQAYSAASFSSKFDRIKQAMFRSEDVEDEATEQDRKSAQYFLDHFLIPAPIAATMPQIIARTRESWERFKVKLTKVSTEDRIRDANFCTRIFVMWSPTFVENWIRSVCLKYGRIENFNLPPLSLVFTPGSEMFKNQFWREWAQDWCGDPTAFDSLLKELLK